MKYTLLISVSLLLISSIFIPAYPHSDHSSEFEKNLEERMKESPLEVSIGGMISVSVASDGKGLTINDSDQLSEISLYEEYFVDPKIIWSDDKTIFAAVIGKHKPRESYLIAVDMFGDELFREEIKARSIDYGWVSSGNNQGLYLNSSNNIVYQYVSSKVAPTRRSKGNIDSYHYTYSGADDEITIFKNNKKVRGITGYLYEISLSPSKEYLMYGSKGGFYIYNFELDEFKHIEGGFDYSLSLDETKVAFVMPEDNGHNVIASDLYIYDFVKDEQFRITDTPDILENVPSWIDDRTIRHSYFDSKEIKEIKLEGN